MDCVLTVCAEQLALLAAGAPADIVNRWAAMCMQAELARFKRIHNQSLLHDCISVGNTAQVLKLLDTPHPFNVEMALADISRGSTPLGLAAATGNVAVVAAMLARGTSHVRQQGEQMAPLLMAIHTGCLETAVLFPVLGHLPLREAIANCISGSDLERSSRWKIFVHIAQTCDVTATGTDGTGALLYAINARNSACAMWLLRHSAVDINTGAPILVASRQRMHNVVAHLLETTVDLNVFDPDGKGLLHSLMFTGEVNLFRRALARGAAVTYTRGSLSRPFVHDVMTYALNNQTPALFECAATRPDVDWGATDSIGNTAIHRLVRDVPFSEHTARDVQHAVSFLCRQAPATVDYISAENKTALVTAIKKNWDINTVLRLFNCSRAYLTVADHPRLLHEAARRGNQPLCFLLRASGYSLEAIDGATPVYTAEVSNHLLVAAGLLHSENMPPLQLACIAGLSRHHINWLMRLGALRDHRPWAPWLIRTIGPTAADALHIRRLRTSLARGGEWARTIHQAFPRLFHAAAHTLLLCQARLGPAGLPLGVSHSVLRWCAV